MVETPRFQDNNRHRKATVWFPALRTGPLDTPGNTPSTHFCSRLNRPQGHSTAGRFMLMKNSNYTIGIRTRDLSDCRAESPHEGHQHYYRRRCSGQPTRQEQQRTRRLYPRRVWIPKVVFFCDIYFVKYLSAPWLFKQHVMRAMHCHVTSAKYISFVTELATPH